MDNHRCLSLAKHPLVEALQYLAPGQLKGILAPYSRVVMTWKILLWDIHLRIVETHPFSADLIMELIDLEIGNDTDRMATMVSYHMFLNTLSTQTVMIVDSPTVTSFVGTLLTQIKAVNPGEPVALLAGIQREQADWGCLIHDYCRKHRLDPRHYPSREQSEHASTILQRIAEDLGLQKYILEAKICEGRQLASDLYHGLYREYLGHF